MCYTSVVWDQIVCAKLIGKSKGGQIWGLEDGDDDVRGKKISCTV